MDDIPRLHISEATRRRNPHLYGPPQSSSAPVPLVTPGKRLRQSQKPLLNKLETRWFAVLQTTLPKGIVIHAQAMRFELARGIWYKPDFAAFVAGTLNAWEVKGPRAFRGGFENLKVAATVFPEVVWKLVWEDGGQWREQVVLSAMAGGG